MAGDEIYDHAPTRREENGDVVFAKQRLAIFRVATAARAFAVANGEREAAISAALEAGCSERRIGHAADLSNVAIHNRRRAAPPRKDADD